MIGKNYKLYDENLVKNIMLSTGVSILEFVKKNKTTDEEKICKFLEYNAENIITNTINNLYLDDYIEYDEYEDYDYYDDDSLLNNEDNEFLLE